MINEQILEIEDYLQENKVFLNGISGRPCHSDSYMTIVDPEALDKAIANSDVDKETIKEAIEYWSTDPNNQPPLKIVSILWKAKL